MSISTVLEDSRLVCLRRFDREPFNLHGWKSLLRNSDGLSEKQNACLSKLWDWRDLLARKLDESLGYVCPGAALLKIARVAPTTMDGLVRTLNPMPPLVLEFGSVVLELIDEATKNILNISTSADTISQLRASASPFAFKPAGEGGGGGAGRGAAGAGGAGGSSRHSPPFTRPSVMSPVLGTEALYKQAGWLTPQPSKMKCDELLFVEGKGEGGTEGEGRGMVTPRLIKGGTVDLSKYLNANNKGFDTSNQLKHSIEIGGGGGRGFEVRRSEGRRQRVEATSAASCLILLYIRNTKPLYSSLRSSQIGGRERGDYPVGDKSALAAANRVRSKLESTEHPFGIAMKGSAFGPIGGAEEGGGGGGGDVV